MINLFIPSKKTLLLVGVLCFAVIILALFTFLSSPSQISAPSATPRPTIIPISNNLPGINSSTPPSSNSVYSPQILEKDYQRLESKKPLSSSDAQIRTKLISQVGDKSGYLNQTSEYKIEYVKGPDLFMVEILSENTDQAKKDATDWFTSRGLSEQGVCDFRLMFYLNYDITSSLSQKGLTFNPIPQGCQ